MSNQELASRPVPAVSIVMPIHNQERVLQETLDSVLAQDYRDFELICVDDGSTDTTHEILQAVVQADSRVSILSLDGVGAAVARNRGLDLARGTYVQFLDSDDIFDSQMLLKMVNALETSGADVCICESDRFNHMTGEAEPHFRFPKRWQSGRIEHGAFGSSTFQIVRNVPWDKMVRRELVMREGIRFQDLPNHNDAFFTVSIMWKARSVYLLHDSLVRYRWALGTSIQDGRAKHPECPLEVAEAVFDSIGSECSEPSVHESLVKYCVTHALKTMRLALLADQYDEALHNRILAQFDAWDIGTVRRCVRQEPELYLPVKLLLDTNYDSVKWAYAKRVDRREQGSLPIKKVELMVRMLWMLVSNRIVGRLPGVLRHGRK